MTITESLAKAKGCSGSVVDAEAVRALLIGATIRSLGRAADRAGRVTALLGHRKPVVEDVIVSRLGDLAITWSPDYSLNAFVDSSGRVESWRALVRGGDHHVFPVESS